jgi:hypothetical protein
MLDKPVRASLRKKLFFDSGARFRAQVQGKENEKNGGSDHMDEISGQISGGSVRVIENRQFLKAAFFRIAPLLSLYLPGKLSHHLHRMVSIMVEIFT